MFLWCVGISERYVYLLGGWEMVCDVENRTLYIHSNRYSRQIRIIFVQLSPVAIFPLRRCFAANTIFLWHFQQHYAKSVCVSVWWWIPCTVLRTYSQTHFTLYSTQWLWRRCAFVYANTSYTMLVLLHGWAECKKVYNLYACVFMMCLYVCDVRVLRAVVSVLSNVRDVYTHECCESHVGRLRIEIKRFEMCVCTSRMSITHNIKPQRNLVLPSLALSPSLVVQPP